MIDFSLPNDKFIPAKLSDVMDKKYIIRRQMYTAKTIKRMKDKKIKYRKQLLKDIKNETAIGKDLSLYMRMNKTNILPKYHLRCVNKDWDCSLPRIRDLIINFLSRDWMEYSHEEISCRQA